MENAPQKVMEGPGKPPEMFCTNAARVTAGEIRQLLASLMPRAGSGVVRIDLLRFLAGCRTR